MLFFVLFLLLRTIHSSTSDCPHVEITQYSRTRGSWPAPVFRKFEFFSRSERAVTVRLSHEEPPDHQTTFDNLVLAPGRLVSVAVSCSGRRMSTARVSVYADSRMCLWLEFVGEMGQYIGHGHKRGNIWWSTNPSLVT